MFFRLSVFSLRQWKSLDVEPTISVYTFWVNLGTCPLAFHTSIISHFQKYSELCAVCSAFPSPRVSVARNSTPALSARSPCSPQHTKTHVPFRTSAAGLTESYEFTLPIHMYMCEHCTVWIHIPQYCVWLLRITQKMLAACPRKPPGSTVLRMNLKAALINRCLSKASSQGDNPCLLLLVCLFFWTRDIQTINPTSQHLCGDRLGQKK